MAKVALLVLLLAGATVRAGPLAADLRAGQPATVLLAAAVDDAHLANPAGYFPTEPPAARVVERIVVENRGRESARNPDVRLNGRPLLPVADPLAALGVADGADLLTLFAAWRERRIHGTTGLAANRDPLAVLHAIGATFCGDDARALGAIAISRGAEVRFARLNGHSAAEHRLGPNADWALLDGDQNAFYLRWDNRTPAAAADVVADPLLALRTKIYGRHATWAAATAWQNAARFELVEPAAPPKILRIKRPAPPRDWELRPGEKIVIHLDRAPACAHGANDERRRDPALQSAICLVEFYALAAGRDGRVALPFPRASEQAGEPGYEAAAAPAPIACQAARAQFPPLRAGRNEITWTGRGALRVSFETRENSRAATPAPSVRARLSGPSFAIEAADAERLWWQISGDREFRLIPPNFDQVGAFTPMVKLAGLLDATFFSPGEPYFFRAKARRGGAWSEWSEPTRFTVEKPGRPAFAGVGRRADGMVRVRWQPAGAGEMLVFGSARLDFLPEVFGAEEPTRIENGAIRERRPAKNLLATLDARAGEAVVPARAVYRLIARRDGELSVPSALARLPGERARVLQNRHVKAAGALTGRDVAVEMTARE